MINLLFKLIYESIFSCDLLQTINCEINSELVKILFVLIDLIKPLKITKTPLDQNMLRKNELDLIQQTLSASYLISIRSRGRKEKPSSYLCLIHLKSIVTDFYFLLFVVLFLIHLL